MQKFIVYKVPNIDEIDELQNKTFFSVRDMVLYFNTLRTTILNGRISAYSSLVHVISFTVMLDRILNTIKCRIKITYGLVSI